MPATKIKPDFLEELGIKDVNSGACLGPDWIEAPSGGELTSTSPVDGQPIAKITMASSADYEKVILKTEEAFKSWRLVPAPQRGEVIRRLGNKLREKKTPLGKLVAYEMGLSEGLKEERRILARAFATTDREEGMKAFLEKRPPNWKGC